MALPLEDSFQYIRYLVDPRKAEDKRLKFTVKVEGAAHPFGIELRNGIIVISDADRNEEVHLDVTLEEWSEFVAGERSFADRNDVLAQFESVLARTVEPKGTDALDDALEDAVDEMEYFCDGGEEH